jgi:DNA-binding MarR family transcriptional regulator
MATVPNDLTLPDEPELIGPEDASDEAGSHRTEFRFWLHLLACTTLIETEIRRKFREEFDFTLARFEVLAQLEREPGGLVLGELPKRLMVTAGSLTPIVDRLVEGGYLTRTPSTIDRRVQIVCLTVEGRRAFRRMAKKHGLWLTALLEQFPREKLERLTEQLGELKRMLKKTPENARRIG